LLTGITDIELLPPATGGMDLVNQIRNLFTGANAIRASIAFWTLSPDQLDDITDYQAERVLKTAESFICVDLQRPTSIDHLSGFVKRGVRIYLNIRKLPKSLDPLKISTSPGLLHTKILLSDKNNGKAEFWIGSHNWTVPALMGPNTELSMSLSLTDRAPLYASTKHTLEDIRDNYCQPFDLNRVEYYKKLQQAYERDTDSKYVIELEGDNVSGITGETICIFGTENDDYDVLSTVRRKVFLSIYDSASKDKFLYQARIIDSGLLSRANPRAGGLTFSKRRHAFTVKRQFPYLQSANIPDSSVLDSAYFFVDIEILKLESKTYQLYDSIDVKKRKSTWTESEWDPAIERMDPQLIGKFYKGQLDFRTLISVPSDDRHASKSRQLGDQKEISEMPLELKRATKDYRLISKRVIEIEPQQMSLNEQGD